MTDSVFGNLIEEGNFSELEGYWLERMETGDVPVQEFLQAARALARQKEKERAGLLLSLLAESFREQERWPERLTVLKEIARFIHEPEKLEPVKEQLGDTFRKIYSDRPSFSRILRHTGFEEIKSSDRLKAAIEKMEWWLRHDIGQVFYEPGYGVGRVVEVNLNLGIVRLDFEKKKDVSIQFGDQELLWLRKEHILREKVEQPEESTRKALEAPGETLSRLLQELERPLTVGEIKEAVAGMISAEQWSRWWNAAKKSPQIVSSGKGAQAVYQWSASAEGAEGHLREEFDHADVRGRMQLAKQHSDRSRDLASYFVNALLADAQKTYESKNWALALEFLEFFVARPSRPHGNADETPARQDPGFTFDQILQNAEPVSLILSIENAAVKQKVLEAIPRVYPEQWTSIYSAAFLQEENPKFLSFVFEKISDQSADALEQILNQPVKYPAAFTWITQNVGRSQLIDNRLDGKFLVSLFSVIDEPEFSSYRNKLKKTIEEGLLLNLLGRPIDAELAQKAIDELENSKNIEDYRRERWKARIRMSFPETKEKEDWIFSTQEAFERKRRELEDLIKVELPKNRKAIGEAAALGDLRENFEYKAARQRQDFLINRVQQLQTELAKVRVLDAARIDCSEVRPGTRVTLYQAPDKRISITILGPWDSNPAENIYSHQAPLAQKLLGKTIGETMEWSEEQWLLEKIEPWS